MKKKLIVVLIAIIGIVSISVAVYLNSDISSNDLYKDIDYEAEKFIKNEVNQTIENYITDEDVYVKLSEISIIEESNENNEMNNNQNLLNKEEGYPSYGLSLIKDETERKEWEEEREKAYTVVDSIFKDGEIKKDSEKIIVEDDVIYYSFIYLSPNKNKYNAYMNLLCEILRNDYFKINQDIEYTLDVEVETIAKGNMIAMQLLSEEYFEVTEIPVTVKIIKDGDTYKVENPSTVIENLNGLMDKNFDFSTEESAAEEYKKMEEEVIGIYKKAIEDGKYDPSNPLQPLKD